MHARHAQATTVVSPLSSKPLRNVQTIVTAHHTSISNITRNQMFGALLQMIPCAISGAELNINSVSALPYNQAAVTVPKSRGWKSNNCAL